MTINKFIVNSANWDKGRAGKVVTGIVLHTTVGTISGAQARFNDPASQVSVHYGIGLDGSITQWVEEADTAYQAGNYSVNQVTIGIEHEDNGNYNDSVRTDALYSSSAQLVADICKRYDFPADSSHILLHKNVIDKSVYPGGTACPDGLNTDRIIKQAGGLMNNYPNVGDLQNITNAQGWQKGADGKTNPDAIAYWANGTNNPHWGNINNVWVALLLEVANFAKTTVPQPKPPTPLTPGTYEVK